MPDQVQVLIHRPHRPGGRTNLTHATKLRGQHTPSQRPQPAPPSPRSVQFRLEIGSKRPPDVDGPRKSDASTHFHPLLFPRSLRPTARNPGSTSAPATTITAEHLEDVEQKHREKAPDKMVSSAPRPRARTAIRRLEDPSSASTGTAVMRPPRPVLVLLQRGLQGASWPKNTARPRSTRSGAER